MELKTARLTLLIDPNKKVAFERLCARQDRTASQVVRQLIRDYLAEHGVDDVGAAVAPPVDPAGASKPSRPPTKPSKAPAKKAGKRAVPPSGRSAAPRR